jgi:hypothetical protein
MMMKALKNIYLASSLKKELVPVALKAFWAQLVFQNILNMKAPQD